MKRDPNFYRQTPWPVAEKPAPGPPLEVGAEYPKMVKCFDGAKRHALSKEHEDQLTTDPDAPIQSGAPVDVALENHIKFMEHMAFVGPKETEPVSEIEKPAPLVESPAPAVEA